MNMLPIAFVFFAIAPLIAAAPGRRGPAVGAWLALSAACALVAFIGAGALVGTTTRTLIVLFLPLIGPFGFALAPLAGLFLLVTAVVFAAALPFLSRDCAAYTPWRRALFVTLVALTLAAMTGVFLAADVASFIICWEIAALAIWGLISFQTRDSQPVAAGLLTLALSELGSLMGFAGLLILASAAGSMHLAAILRAAPDLAPGITAAGCVLTFFGFGMKAGIVPLNLWLPAAHGSAPRAISPILSGATLNLGLYAFLHLDAALARTEPWLGLMILATGAATALTGIVYAMMERDLKRLLAQSSIENIGIATAGFGAGFAFAALDHPMLAGLALVAGLYHMINHSAYKTLLFLGAGGIDVAAGTHHLDDLGGLMRRVPLLATLFLLGTFAIAALPPFNGFVSEWLTLESLLRVVEVGPVAVRIIFALAGAALALTAGLAVTCFVMVSGSGLLGLPRSSGAAEARSAPRTVTIPMLLLTVICLGLGVLATGVIPVLGRLIAPLIGTDASAALVPNFFHGAPSLAPALFADLTHIGARIGHSVLPLRGLVVLHSSTSTPVVFAMSTGLTFAVLAFLLLAVWVLARVLRRRRVTRSRLWDAGLTYLRPDMTYTATAFASPVRVLFDAVLKPVVSSHRSRHGAFVTGLRHEESSTHIVERWVINPVTHIVRAIANALARLHHGRVTHYAGYVLIALLAALLIASGLYY